MVEAWLAMFRRGNTSCTNSGGTAGRIPNPIRKSLWGRMKSGTREAAPRAGQSRMCPPTKAWGGRLERTCEIDMTFAKRGTPLFFQRRDCSRAWDAVQRHVDEASRTTGGGGLRGGFKTLPFRAARLVYVYVNIHQTG